MASFAIPPHKHCIYCGEVIDFSKPQECKASHNPVQAATNGKRSHIYLEPAPAPPAQPSPQRRIPSHGTALPEADTHYLEPEPSPQERWVPDAETLAKKMFNFRWPKRAASGERVPAAMRRSSLAWAEAALAALSSLGSAPQEDKNMPNAMTPVASDDPRMIAWKAYVSTPEYANSRKWALAVNYEDGRAIRPEMHEQNVEGSLWAAFIAGFEAALPAPPAQPSPQASESREKAQGEKK